MRLVKRIEQKKDIGLSRQELNVHRVQWTWGYWLGVVGLVGAATLLNSSARAELQLPKADGVSVSFVLVVWAVSGAVLIRSAYLLSLHKGTPKRLAAWGSLLAPLCLGIPWYGHYLHKPDRYPYPKTDEG